MSTSEGDIYELFYHPSRGFGKTMLARFQDVADIGSFYSPDDGYRHVIVGTRDGEVTEVFYKPKGVKGQTTIGVFPGLTRVSCFYVDKSLYNRRIQVATANGDVHELRFTPKAGSLHFRLVNSGPVTDIGGFYSPDDKTKHSICAYPSGDVKELFYDI